MTHISQAYRVSVADGPQVSSSPVIWLGRIVSGAHHELYNTGDSKLCCRSPCRTAGGQTASYQCANISSRVGGGFKASGVVSGSNNNDDK